MSGDRPPPPRGYRYLSDILAELDEYRAAVSVAEFSARLADFPAKTRAMIQRRRPEWFPRPPQRPPLAASLAKVAAVRAEFPDWYLAPGRPRGWVARMGNLTVRAATLDELAQILRDARDDA